MDNPDITITEQVLLAPLTAWRIGDQRVILRQSVRPKGSKWLSNLLTATICLCGCWVAGATCLSASAGLAGVRHPHA
jgi:hypothetical protein